MLTNKKNNRIIKLFLVVVALFATTTFFSCGNSSEKIQEANIIDTLPSEQAKDVTMYYSDSGLIKAKLTTPLMKRYENKESKSILKLINGLAVFFYDSLGIQDAKLTAKYGERQDETQIFEVKYDVVVLNADSEKLFTDHLIWDQHAGRIYSDVFVKIITPDKIIWGDGFESDEHFEKYKILNTKGELYLKDDE